MAIFFEESFKWLYLTEDDIKGIALPSVVLLRNAVLFISIEGRFIDDYFLFAKQTKYNNLYRDNYAVSSYVLCRSAG